MWQEDKFDPSKRYADLLRATMMGIHGATPSLYSSCILLDVLHLIVVTTGAIAALQESPMSRDTYAGEEPKGAVI